jgi:hypothetical protein
MRIVTLDIGGTAIILWSVAQKLSAGIEILMQLESVPLER